MKSASAQDMLEALQKLGHKDAEIAALAGVSQPTITRLRNGYYTSTSHDTWLRIHEIFLKKQAPKKRAA